jgi:hypothetical protein
MPLRDLCPSLFTVLAGAVTVSKGTNFDREDDEDVRTSSFIFLGSIVPSPE